jgi:hypothetical protein
MDAERIAVDAVVALTDCDRDTVAAFIRRFYLAGVKDPPGANVQGPAGDGAGLSLQHATYSARSKMTRKGGHRPALPRCSGPSRGQDRGPQITLPCRISLTSSGEQPSHSP